MRQNKNKKTRSPKIRWKIFGFMLVPSILLISVLWVTQTVFLGVFYAGIKTEELKNTTEDVIENIENNDIHDKILFWSSNGNINIRVIETSEFNSLYSTGDAFDSVTYNIGTFGMLEMYEEALENNGELVRYYSEEDGYADYFKPPVEDGNGEMIPPPDFSRKGENEEARSFREHFHMVPRPAFFDNVGKHNDLLYVRITTLSDGSEVMVAADTRISPLDSTVKALRVLLLWGTVIAVVVSLVLSFIIAKHISKPIEARDIRQIQAHRQSAPPWIQKHQRVCPALQRSYMPPCHNAREYTRLSASVPLKALAFFRQ